MAEVALFPDTKEAGRWLAALGEKVKNTQNGAKEFAGLVSSVVFRDIIGHFEDERGAKGPWKAWSDAYEDHMERLGKGGNKILQDTGRLRQAFTPASYRSVPEGLLWFNPAKTKGGHPYAAAHDQGEGVPQRDFMWLSDDAQERIAQMTLNYILDDG